MYGPHRHFAPLLARTLRRISQAVSAVATDFDEWQRMDYRWFVSIPQAVSAVATFKMLQGENLQALKGGSIPQAVRTVATLCIHVYVYVFCFSFNTASGRYIHSILFVFPFLRSGTRDVRTSSSLRSSAGTLHRIPQTVSTVTTGYEIYEDIKDRLAEFQYRKR